VAQVRKGYVELPHGRLHFRYGGSGPPVVLLHDSPRSSVLHAPNVAWLGEHFAVFAFDSPGFGESAPLPGRPEVGDFAEAIARACAALGLGRCLVYGFHSSSKFALEFAVRHPAQVALLVMDGLALPPQAANEDYLQRYLVPFEPDSAGAYVLRHWVKSLDFHRFFPWFEQDAAHRLQLPLPDPLGFHEYVTDVFMAGTNWTGGYGAALRFLAAPRLAELRTPSVVMCREDDVLYCYLDSLPQPLPPGCRMERVGPSVGAWRERLLAALREADLPALQWSPPDTLRGPGAGLRCGYVALAHGDLHLSACGAWPRGSQAPRPLLLLHDLPGCAASLEVLMVPLGADRLCLAPDLPGTGESTALPEGGVEVWIGALLAMLDSLDLATVDVYAEGLAGSLAVALAVRAPGRVGRLLLDGPVVEDGKTRLELSVRLAPPLAPRHDGTHLVELWHRLRSAELCWPWYGSAAHEVRRREPRLDPRHLHTLLVQAMKQPAHYGDAARAALELDLTELLPACGAPVLALWTPEDPRESGVAVLAEGSGKLRLQARSQAPDRSSVEIAAFLRGD
jgi:pimeloyl-ACP methyl ester carboxylesterase